MKQYIIITLVVFFTSFISTAQNGIIKGTVKNEKNNEPIPFANVVIQNTTIGAVTDFDGKFVISGVNTGFVRLEASSVGFQTRVTPEFQVTNSNETNIEIVLKESTTQLSTVTVSAGIFERDIESPVSMQTIGVSEIEKNPGGNRDISKIVQSFPGVGQTPVQRNDLIIRGGGANENRFFIDGIEFPNLNHFATQGASGGPASIINADFLREVNLYTGSFQANTGNALSSVLDMTLIVPSKEKAIHRVTIGASDFGFTYNGPLTDNTGILFSYRRSYLQFLFSAIGLPFLPTYNDYLIKTKTTFKNNDQLSIISLGAYDVNRLNLDRNETDQQRYILEYLPETNQWNYTFGATYRHFRKNGYSNFIASRNMFRNSSFKYQDNVETDSLKIQDYTSDEIENKFRFENVVFNKGWRWLTGFSGEYAKYSNTTFQKLFISGNQVNVNYNSSFDMFKYGLFAQVSGKLFKERLGLSVGLRTDGNNFNSSMQNPLNQLSPRLTLNYSISERWFATLSAARYSQLPAYTTMGYTENSQPVNKNGNLSYILAWHYVAGVEFIPDPNSLISIEGFYKGYSNYPVSLRDSVSLANKGGDFGVVGDEPVSSVGTGRAYGFEILIRRKLIEKMNFLLSYTFVKSEFTDLSGNYIPSAWDAGNIANILLSRNFKHNWTIGARWKYSGGSPYTPYDENTSSLVQAWDVQGRPYLNYSQYNTLRLKPYHQLDIRVDKQYFFKKWSLTAYIDIQNAYNFQYTSQSILLPAEDANGNPIIVNPTDPIDQQHYQMKTIENVGGNVLPTLGLIFEF